MNSKGLSKHYEKLQPNERLPLLLAALARQDDVESCRLLESAPDEVLQQPDYARFAAALSAVADHYLLTMLNLAAEYWRAYASCLERQFTGTDNDRAQHCGRLYRAQRLFAYLLINHEQAWRLFCAELTLDPALVLSGLPGRSTAESAVEAAREDAFSEEEALGWARRRDPETGMATAASVLELLKTHFQERFALGGKP